MLNLLNFKIMRNNSLRLIKQSVILGLLAFIATVYSCNEAEIFNYPDTGAPGNPSNVIVENTYGGAIIKYKLPNDPNLAYVRASYEVNGESYSKISSIYGNELKIDGFGDTLQHNVVLNGVSLAGIESETGIDITIQPMTSPVELVKASLQAVSTFGGAVFKWENIAQADIYVSVSLLGDDGEYYEMERYYSDYAEEVQTIRGLDTLNYEFVFQVGDRWGNETEQITKTVRPVYEIKFDKALWTDTKWPQDIGHWANTNRFYVKDLWDGNINRSTNGSWRSQYAAEMPLSIGWDLGVKVKLSRIVLYPTRKNVFKVEDPRKFEFWGSENPMSGDLNDGTWFLIDQMESLRPSGSTVPANVQGLTGLEKDLDLYGKGMNYDFPADTPPVRYMRFVVYETWGSMTRAALSEIDIYGSVIQD